jgi:hypothetical protein
MTDMDQRRIAEWIGDAFAILCVRIGGLSEAETQVRLGFEAILRQLGSSPLHVIAQAPPPLFASSGATAADLRLILKALDSCVAVFDRYMGVLSESQRAIEQLVRSTREHTRLELRRRSPAPATITRIAQAAA